MLFPHTIPCDLPVFRACWTVSGKHDVALLVEAAGLEELNRLRERLERHPSVIGLTTLHLPKTWHRRFR